jgi:hypothetical protein
MCNFEDLQYISTVGHIARSFLHDYIKTRWFRPLFLLHIVLYLSFLHYRFPLPGNTLVFGHYVTLEMPTQLFTTHVQRV